MRDQANTWQRRMEAAESAISLLNELRLDQTRQVDIFGVCEHLGLWLAFMPLEGTLGAFVPEGAGGILITTQRPTTVQRYTAAHELAHWRLEDRQGVIDGNDDIFGTSAPERERLAQIFAANFLMPPPLIYSVLGRLGYRGGDRIRPVEGYTVAREAGVSYEAAVRQLANLELVSTPEATNLLKERPMAIKASLAWGRRPVNGYADVWPVDEQWNDHAVSLRVEDEVVISLPENRTTGYQWMFPNDDVVQQEPPPQPFGDVVSPPDQERASRFLAAAAAAPKTSAAPSQVLRRLRSRQHSTNTVISSPEQKEGADIVGDDYLPARSPVSDRRDRLRFRLAAAGRDSADHPLAEVGTDSGGLQVGAAGRRIMSIRFPQPGRHSIRLSCRSLYSDEAPVSNYVLHVLVEARRNRFSIDQLIDEQDGWVEEIKQRRLKRAEPNLDPGRADPSD